MVARSGPELGDVRFSLMQPTPLLHSCDKSSVCSVRVSVSCQGYQAQMCHKKCWFGADQSIS